MVYADPNMLISVKAGNKIIFDAERVNGQLIHKNREGK